MATNLILKEICRIFVFLIQTISSKISNTFKGKYNCNLDEKYTIQVLQNPSSTWYLKSEKNLIKGIQSQLSSYCVLLYGIVSSV